MIVRVIIPPRVENAFRKAALAAFPHEHAEAMRGRVVGDTVTITRFVPISHTTATPDTVEYLHDDAIVKKDAGDAFVGVAHSHPGPDSDPAPSLADWKSAFECGEIVSGIVVVDGEKRKAGKLYFYESRPPIAVVHPRVRAPRKKSTPSIILDASVGNVQNPVPPESSKNVQSS